MLSGSYKSSLASTRSLANRVTELCNIYPSKLNSPQLKESLHESVAAESGLWELALQHKYFRTQTLNIRSQLLLRLVDADLLPELLRLVTCLEDQQNALFLHNQLELLLILSDLWSHKQFDTILGLRPRRYSVERTGLTDELWIIQLTALRIFQSLSMIAKQKVEQGMCRLLQTFSDLPLQSTFCRSSLVIIYWCGCVTLLGLFVANDKDFSMKIAKLTAGLCTLDDGESLLEVFVHKLAAQEIDLTDLETYALTPSMTIWELLTKVKSNTQRLPISSLRDSHGHGQHSASLKSDVITQRGDYIPNNQSFMSRRSTQSEQTQHVTHIPNDLREAQSEILNALEAESKGQLKQAAATYKIVAQILPQLLGNKEQSVGFTEIFRLSGLSRLIHQNLDHVRESDLILSKFIKSTSKVHIQVDLLLSWHKKALETIAWHSNSKPTFQVEKSWPSQEFLSTCHILM